MFSYAAVWAGHVRNEVHALRTQYMTMYVLYIHGPVRLSARSESQVQQIRRLATDSELLEEKLDRRNNGDDPITSSRTDTPVTSLRLSVGIFFQSQGYVKSVACALLYTIPDGPVSKPSANRDWTVSSMFTFRFRPNAYLIFGEFCAWPTR